MKTNKSYTKRIRVTRRGKLIVRVPGQDHFNAKESGAKHLRRKRAVKSKLPFSVKTRTRFINK